MAASRPQLNQSEVGRLGGQVVVLGRWLYDYLVMVGRAQNRALSTPAVGPSPWTYTNDTGFDVTASIIGGNVSSISLVRDGVSTLLSGVSPYLVPVAPLDALIVTYAPGAPTVTIIPR